VHGGGTSVFSKEREKKYLHEFFPRCSYFVPILYILKRLVLDKIILLYIISGSSYITFRLATCIGDRSGHSPWTFPPSDIFPRSTVNVYKIDSECGLVPVFIFDRSLYVDWRMVVMVGGTVLHHVKRKGNCLGRGNVRGYVRGGRVDGSMSYIIGDDRRWLDRLLLTRLKEGL